MEFENEEFDNFENPFTSKDVEMKDVSSSFWSTYQESDYYKPSSIFGGESSYSISSRKQKEIISDRFIPCRSILEE